VQSGHSPIHRVPPAAGMRHTARMSAPVAAFTERGFYLDEFRGRTLGFVCSGATPAEVGTLRTVFDALGANGTRCVVMSTDASLLDAVGAKRAQDGAESSWPARVWQAVSAERCPVGVETGGAGLTASVVSATLGLGLRKLVWLRGAGGLRSDRGTVASFMDLDELRRFAAAKAEDDGERAVLAEIEPLLEGGVPSVNLCGVGGLDQELFTYAGSGTLFTRERYADVRRLALDEFDAARDLIERGVAEGYLVQRDSEGLLRVLSGGIGVFIEGRDLAGVGALLPHVEVNAAEIASLYTVTRYLGEGIGHQIVGYAVARAQEAGFDYVFACTTSDRVATFFERAGFMRVEGSAIPPAKWDGYPVERRARLICLRFDRRT
jgi:amino-acid N-acetyltransferase